MNIRFGGPLLIIIAALLWALDGVLRRSLFSLSPITIVLYEHAIGAVLIAPFFFSRFRKERFTSREWGAVLWVSLLSGLLGTLWFTTALTRVNFISFSVVFLLQKLQPLFAIAAARVVLRERITRPYLMWAVAALGAAYFVTFKDGIVDLSTGSDTMYAALFAVGAAFAWGTSTAFSRYALLNHTGTVVTALRFFITVPLAFAAALLLGGVSSIAAPSGDQTIKLVLIAFSTGLVALWIYYQGLKHTRTAIATILELVFPMAAVFIDIVLYHTVLSASQYAAAAVLLYAIYRVSLLNRNAASPVFQAAVLAGKGKGRELGYPTLNFAIPSRFRYRYGIYAGQVDIDGAVYMAAFHFGPVPVYGQTTPTLEAHLLDVQLPERPTQASFSLHEYLREVRAFESERDLARQIARDIEQAREIMQPHLKSRGAGAPRSG
ncbi:MAG: EamA family transporter [Patescibacteria group bacterium]